MSNINLLGGDCLEVLKTLPEESVDCCVTSPPYFGLRDYGVNGQVGLEQTPDEYIQKLVEVFSEVRRVLKTSGTLWLNIGDSYAGSNGNGYRQSKWVNGDVYHSDKNYNLRKVTGRTDYGCKPKEIIGIPWMLAFALRNDGWYLRQDIIWQKPNCMPESVKDRCTKSHEYIFLLTKSPKYYFDSDSIKEPAMEKHSKRYNSAFNSGAKETSGGGRPNNARNTAGMKTYTGFRNKRDVWSINIANFRGAHFATFPEKLVEPCVLAGCPENGIVLDPFMGSGTTGVVAKKHGRNFVGIKLNPEYLLIAAKRIENAKPG